MNSGRSILNNDADVQGMTKQERGTWVGKGVNIGLSDPHKIYTINLKVFNGRPWMLLRAILSELTSLNRMNTLLFNCEGKGWLRFLL